MNIGVLGGGPAGMLAAYFAAEHNTVTLLEQNEKLGKKLFITGKGRCNVTNAAREEEFMAGLVRNPRFLYSALHFFDNEALMALLEKAGVPLKTERGNRVFPVSDKSSDILRALEGLLRGRGVKVKLNTRVDAVTAEENGFAVQTRQGVLHFDRLIVATGGLSYPATGSDGSGLNMAKTLGHTLTPLLGSLVSVETKEDWPFALTGLTFKNVALTAKRGKKTLFHEQGEMLLTHFGISGPLVLSMSSYTAGLPVDELELFIDMKPALPLDTLLVRIRRDIEAEPRKQASTLLAGLVPHAMAQPLAALCGIDQSVQCAQLTREQRETLAATLKALPLHIRAFRPVKEAIVTRGGISVKEIDPRTMGSKLHPGLFFAGEMLDVDGVTGGFNLQIAFSTGALAGASAAAQP